jgi:hypothetical protein
MALAKLGFQKRILCTGSAVEKSMSEARFVIDWMHERRISLDELVARTSLDKKIVEAIIAGRYTPSPKQREVLARELAVEISMIQWGQGGQVDHMYGHGPQFGRSP